MGYFVKNRKLGSGTAGVVLPTGGSATRPTDPMFGLIRYNTDFASVEYFNGIQFVTVGDANSISYTVDSFTGDGSTTVFTMSVSQSAATQIIVFVGSVYQSPVSSYTVDGGFDLTFLFAPPNGEPISVIHSTN
jgi:hypothetical protein